MSDPDYLLDIRGISDPSARSPLPGPEARPWIGIRFECCSVYTRIYRNAEGTAYQGACPKCLRKVRLAVGPGGTDARFFTAQ